MKTNPGPGCSKQGQDNPGLVRNPNTDMKALKQIQFSFCLQCNDLMRYKE